ncbi:class I histocompatibility antigen, F10 alpha chain-like protein [Lates japonicus]|uniref:Class I histocompatibility antigen, F10 alpha chain-like protein n=1 Tax=Lates japonicus TaxID=270547 RepID=A0AAD3MSC1_LATJO|nr:class I histocompatibility antigen, F10 alpha chain-like protein [Lates japonicus]
MTGCEGNIQSDGKLKFHRGLYMFSYDGNDFLSFDNANSVGVTQTGTRQSRPRGTKPEVYLFAKDSELRQHHCGRGLTTGFYQRHHPEDQEDLQAPGPGGLTADVVKSTVATVAPVMGVAGLVILKRSIAAPPQHTERRSVHLSGTTIRRSEVFICVPRC